MMPIAFTCKLPAPFTSNPDVSMSISTGAQS